MPIDLWLKHTYFRCLWIFDQTSDYSVEKFALTYAHSSFILNAQEVETLSPGMMPSESDGAVRNVRVRFSGVNTRSCTKDENFWPVTASATYDRRLKPMSE